jgi:hypothetical protein
LMAPRLTRGRCHDASQCEPRAASWWRRRRRPRERTIRDEMASPSTVPGSPSCSVERGCRACRLPRTTPSARHSRPAPLACPSPERCGASGE